MRVDAHVLIRNPDQGKPGNEIAAPVIIEQLVAGERQKKNCDVVAEAVFRREDVKELAGDKMRSIFRLTSTVCTRFAEDLLVSDCRGDGCNGLRQNKKPADLQTDRLY